MNKTIIISAVILSVITTAFMHKVDDTDYLTDLEPSADLRIIYFWQPGCSHCSNMEPLIDKLINNGFNIIKVNLMNNPETGLAYGIAGTPTIIINGVKIEGERSAAELRDMIEYYK